MNIDYDQYPLLKDATYKEVILLPGDMLFIPRHYWHFIVSISHDQVIDWYNKNSNSNDNCNDYNYTKDDNYSFSVSFWWGRRILKV